MDATPARRLSFEDAGFLYYERPEAPLHVGSLGIYEGKISFETLVNHIGSRIHTIPRYRQRVRFVPFNLNHPVWEDDPKWDLANHMRRFRPRGSVDDRRLASIVAELFAPRLDHDHPPWDVTLIEGLTGDRTAVLCRAHHCMIDGVSGLELLVAVLDMSPIPRHVAPPKKAWKPRPPDPALRRMSDAAWDWTAHQFRSWMEVPMMIADPRSGYRRASSFARAFQKAGRFLLTPPPSTPINRPVKPQRAYAWTEMPFADLRAIRAVLGGTINDVALTVLTGGLRRYLGARSGGTPAPQVRVLVPVNVRKETEQGALGNRVSFMMLGMPLAEKNPLQRFQRVRKEMADLKSVRQAEGIDIFIQLLGQIAPPLARRGAGPLATRMFTQSNLVCTNVAGPMVPLYAAGHRLLQHYPIVPVSYDLGVNVGVMSYDHKLFWGLLTNAETLPDPQRLARDIDAAFQELMAAAHLTPSQVPELRRKPSRPKTRRAAEKAAAKDGQLPLEAAALQPQQSVLRPERHHARNGHSRHAVHADTVASAPAASDNH